MPAASPRNAAISPVHYRVEAADLNAHLFRITLTVQEPAALQSLSLPVWIPGSYLVREFSKNLQRLEARQGRRRLPAQQSTKNTWAVACDPTRPLEVHYEVYAFDNSVRTAWLDGQRGFFNGTSLCLRVHGAEKGSHSLEVAQTAVIAGWQVATALESVKTDRSGYGLYRAADYDSLVDTPVELGSFWSGSFVAGGVPHRFVVAGTTPSFDGERLLADARRICETAIRFWHGRGKPPHTNYLFLLNAVDDGYGGLEHRNSTALICKRADLPRIGESHAGDGYTTLLGLISHEYFHTWNVKRLRPAEFAHYDYEQENYTELLWFFEGFTSYYDDLLLRRAGLIDDATYLRLLGKTINQVRQTPGRHVQSVAQASFDAWTKYYRQDENTPNATVSYYTKGALVALSLDLSLRNEGRTNLDAVMRALWTASKGGPIRESDLLSALESLTGRSWSKEIAAWVHGTGDLPLEDLLPRFGAAILEDAAPTAQRLGLRVAEQGGSIQVKMVLRGGAAERAGLAAGDEWFGIEVAGQAWRLARLDELMLYAGAARTITVLAARDRRILRLKMVIPTNEKVWRLSIQGPDRMKDWLSAAA